MTFPELWRNRKRIIVPVALLAASCGLAVWVRILVAADTLDDLPAVGAQVCVMLMLVAAAAVTIVGALRARGLAERIMLRLVPVALVIVAATFIKTSYIDLSVSLHALLTSAEAGETSMALGPNGRDIRITGELVEGAADKLAALLEANPTVERIHLTSEGGLVDEGDALRKVIAAHALTTFVPDYCVSACTLAFLGGRERLVMTGARVGFHGPFEEGLFGQQFGSDNDTERALYLAAGVAPDFVDAALDVAPADIWTPGADRLIAAHVATGVVGRYRFPDSNLDGAATLAGARTALVHNFPPARTLEARQPRALDAMAAWYLDAYRKGLSEGQVVDGLTALAKHATAVTIAGAKG